MLTRLMLLISLPIASVGVHAETLTDETARFRAEADAALETAAIHDLETFVSDFKASSLKDKAAVIDRLIFELDSVQAKVIDQVEKVRTFTIVSDDDQRLKVPRKLFMAGAAGLIVAGLVGKTIMSTEGTKWYSSKSGKKYRWALRSLSGLSLLGVVAGGFTVLLSSVEEAERIEITVAEAREMVTELRERRTKLAALKLKYDALDEATRK